MFNAVFNSYLSSYVHFVSVSVLGVCYYLIIIMNQISYTLIILTIVSYLSSNTNVNLSFFPGVRFKSRPATPHSNTPTRGQALPLHPVSQGVRQLLIPGSTLQDPPWHQALPLRDLPKEVYPAVTPSAAHQNPHR